MHQKFERFRSQFTFDRSLTEDLLRSLSNDELQWSPGDAVGPFWKQFRHVGRVQENYVAALKSGKVSFQATGSYVGGPDRDALLAYFAELDRSLMTELYELDETAVIDWFGQEQIGVFDHLLRMMGHETLHHGQWIVYCKLMKKPFPKSWSIWGVE